MGAGDFPALSLKSESSTRSYKGVTFWQMKFKDLWEFQTLGAEQFSNCLNAWRASQHKKLWKWGTDRHEAYFPHLNWPMLNILLKPHCPESPPCGQTWPSEDTMNNVNSIDTQILCGNLGALQDPKAHVGEFHVSFLAIWPSRRMYHPGVVRYILTSSTFCTSMCTFM